MTDTMKYLASDDADGSNHPHDEGRSLRRLKTRRPRRRPSKIRVRPSFLCLFYILSLTTDLGTWNGSYCSSSNTRQTGDNVLDLRFLACAVEVDIDSENKILQQENETQDGGEPQRLRRAIAVLPEVDPVLPTAELPAKKKETLTFHQILVRAAKRGLGGGVPGAVAGAIQVRRNKYSASTHSRSGQ